MKRALNREAPSNTNTEIRSWWGFIHCWEGGGQKAPKPEFKCTMPTFLPQISINIFQAKRLAAEDAAISQTAPDFHSVLKSLTVALTQLQKISKAPCAAAPPLRFIFRPPEKSIFNLFSCSTVMKSRKQLFLVAQKGARRLEERKKWKENVLVKLFPAAK